MRKEEKVEIIKEQMFCDKCGIEITMNEHLYTCNVLKCAKELCISRSKDSVYVATNKGGTIIRFGECSYEDSQILINWACNKLGQLKTSQATAR